MNKKLLILIIFLVVIFKVFNPEIKSGISMILDFLIGRSDL